MRMVTIDEIKDIAAYEKVRNTFRQQIIELKSRRRVQVGNLITLLFENRDTITFQVQEMMRAERIVEDSQIQHELDTYNELLPGPLQLSATLFIEIPDPQELRRLLPTLLGLEHHLWLKVQDYKVQAQFEEGHSTEERISTVHYIRFQLSPEASAAFQQPESLVTLEIDHPNYHESIVLPETVRATLAHDLEDY